MSNIDIASLIKNPKVVIGLIVLVIILSLLSTFFGYSYKKVSVENSTLKSEVDTLDKKLKSKYSFTEIKEPVLLGGKVFYKTTTKYITSTSTATSSTHSQSVSIVTKTVTVTKKDFATFGLGYDLDKTMYFSAQRNLLNTPVGNIGLMAIPDFTSLKETRLFITYQP